MLLVTQKGKHSSVNDETIEIVLACSNPNIREILGMSPECTLPGRGHVIEHTELNNPAVQDHFETSFELPNTHIK